MRSFLSTTLGLLLFGLVLFINRQDLSAVGHAMRQAPAGLAILFLVHVPQLVLTGLAWRTLLPPTMRPAVRTMVGLRWIRESLNALVPAGAIIGQAVAARRLTQAGIPADLAGATATVDMTIEGGTQAVITLVGLGLLLVVRGDLQMGGVVMIGIALAVAATVAMVTVQRNLPVRLVQAACGRLAPNWSALNGDWLADFQRSVLRLHAERRTLLRAATFHLSAWTLGAVDIAGVLYLLGHPISLADGFVVESLTQALRSAAFMVPGALGVQEGAVIVSCGLVGVPVDAALTLALLRRTREVLLGVFGLYAARRMRSTRVGSTSTGTLVNPK